MSDNLPDVAETIKAARAAECDLSNGEHFPPIIAELCDLLESLSARVTQAEEMVESMRGLLNTESHRLSKSGRAQFGHFFANWDEISASPGTGNEASDG